MTQQSPHAAGSAATPGRRRPELSTPEGLQAFELRERLAAIVDELRLLDTYASGPSVRL